MSKDTKINLVLAVWLLIGIYTVKTVYESWLPWGTTDALMISAFPSIPTAALAIALSIRLTK